MSETEKVTPLQFAQRHLSPFRVTGAEIIPTTCPVCKGGSGGDSDTFALNMYTGAWNCKRGSCAAEGGFQQLADMFGEDGEVLNPQNYSTSNKKTYTLPTTELFPITDQIISYFDKRKISVDTLNAFQIASDANGNIVFPFYRRGELVFVKMRPPRKVDKGEKKEWREKNTEPILFGMDNCAFGQQLTVCEGQIDAMSLYEAGIHNVVSVPSGSEDLEWVNLCWDWLDKFDDILIFGDADEPGQGMVQKLVKMLGEARCSTITDYPVRPGDTVPCKDANEILYFYGAEKLAEIVQNAPRVEIKGIIRLADVKMVDYTVLPRVRSGIPKLDELTGGMFDGCVTIITGEPGCGKLLADTTPVLTRKGWKQHGDLVVGDEVIGRNGEFVKVQHVFPKHAANMEISLTNGEHIKCHENHEWIVNYQGKPNSERIITAKELFDRGIINGSESIVSHRQNSGKLSYIYRIIDKSPLVGEWKQLQVKPYTLGVWLGNGMTKSPTICSSEKDMCVINSIIQDDGYKVAWETRHKDTGVRYFGFKNLRVPLAKYGMCHSRKILPKYIPDEYLTANQEQRLELLAGLVDTDGCVDKTRGRYHYSTTVPELRDSVVALISTLGWRATLYSAKPKMSSSGIIGRKTVYTIAFYPTIPIPCRVARKRIKPISTENRISVASVRYCQEEQGNCIQVENGVYRVGHTLTPTHNSTITGTLLLNAIEQGHSVFAYSGELPKEKFLQWIIFQAAGSDYIGLKEDKYRGAQVPHVSQDASSAIVEWFYDKFFLADNAEILSENEADAIIRLCEQAARRYGCHLFLIDNAMTAVADSSDERLAQIKLIKNIKKFAMRYDAHVILVAHPRKIGAGQQIQGSDISGAKELYNLADTLFTVEKPDIRIIKNRDAGINAIIECVYCPDSRRIYQADVGDIYNYSWRTKGVKLPSQTACSLAEYKPRIKMSSPI